MAKTYHIESRTLVGTESQWMPVTEPTTNKLRTQRQIKAVRKSVTAFIYRLAEVDNSRECPKRIIG